MKFEKQVRRVVYVPEDGAYRATIDPVTSEKRRPIDAKTRLVGVQAAVAFWDGPDKRNHCLACAKTVGEAFSSGDRYLLDTDEARKDAELVADLAETKPDERDICLAISELSNAIAKVRLNDLKEDDFDVLDVCESALSKCFSIDGFEGWRPPARRRRFMYELSRKDRTPVICTLMGLYFECGATSILTARQRQELLSIGRGSDIAGACRYMDDCLRKITEYRFA